MPKVTAKPKSKKSQPKRRRVRVARSWVKEQYSAVMPQRKRHRILIWVAFLFVAVCIAAQVSYPLNRAVPFARLGESAVGGRTELDIAKEIGDAFARAQVTLQSGERKSQAVAFVKTGAQVNADAMVCQLSAYPLWQRWIPGSILWQRPVVKYWNVEYNARQLQEFSRGYAGELSFAATNAGLAIKDGALIATEERSGRQVTGGDIVRSMTIEPIPYSTAIVRTLHAKEVSAAKTLKDLSAVKQRAEEVLARTVQIRAGELTVTPTTADRALWLRLADDEAGQTTLLLDEEQLGRYLDEAIIAKVGKPAGRTNVTIRNGQEVGREEGQKGLTIDRAALIASLRAYLTEHVGGPLFVAQFVDVAPTVVYNNTYTATREGLEAYINEKARHGAWINIQQLDGERWSVGADDHDSVVSGSTYKLYVALYLFKEMNKGRVTWGTPILDTTTDTCFNRMTIASTNPCAEEWLRQFGRQNINTYLYSKGFSSATTFVHPQATHTSAADLSKFMIGLENGTLVGGAQRERLLYSLRHHPYRYGIPTGSKGQVWDKVGFVFNYVNDTAIVYHPRGKYVMTIMTQGQSYGAIAAMTRDIERIMYP